MKRTIVVFAALISVLVASLGAQSLADLAKLEKERRAQLLGRRGPVVTSRELARVKKTNAVVVTPVEGAALNEAPAPEGRDAGAAIERGLSDAEAETDPAGQPGATEERSEDPLADTPEGLASQLQTIDGVVEGLTEEMNTLRQQYESQDAMVPGYVIQQRLDETGQRLARAQARQSDIEIKMTKMGLAVRKKPSFIDR